jgi:DNA-binding NtrC family response regulator
MTTDDTEPTPDPHDPPEAITRQIIPTIERIGQLRLRFIEGPHLGQELVFQSDTVRGGRSPSPINELVLADEHVSGVHFDLTIDSAGGVLLRDLGSRNGVHLGAARIKEAWLEPGACFRVGASVIELVGADPVTVQLSARARFGGLYGESPVMRELFAKCERYARMSLSALIHGETGTGKELLARALHDHSTRAAGPYVTLNCAAIPPHLAEAQLFGHIRGAFTDAKESAPGYFVSADHGTLFLDEIGELPLGLQAKLLRVLQEGEVQPVGTTKTRRVDVRVIAATHRDLRDMIADRAFREDLYFRLAGIGVTIPPLRSRPSDILPLAAHLLARHAEERHTARKRLSDEAENHLLRHRWPGNVRELWTVLTRAAEFVEGPTIDAHDLDLDPWRAAAPPPPPPPPSPESNDSIQALLARPMLEAVQDFERLYLRHLRARGGGWRDWTRHADLTEQGLRNKFYKLLPDEYGPKDRKKP